ncbi:MAG: carboxypeptidase-like regulatory domain-containing protein [Bacteroidales bacterium]|nr:carboxypeptidase-like regulatory domain-containing protein [Bacteroidales bacterium]
MKNISLLLMMIVISGVASACYTCGEQSIPAAMTFSPSVVVADSTTGVPLPGASVYDRHGKPIGVSDGNGKLPRIQPDSYPLTIRYIGFEDKTVTIASDTVFLNEDISLLPEIVVESRRHKVLHMLAYVRECSTLSTYTDTVFLFREKMVDFIFTPDKKVRFKGWSTPRTLTSKSYYRFTNSVGLDSVSDVYSNHFSWADWMGVAPDFRLPAKLRELEVGSDTISGKYSPSEIYARCNDKLRVDVNVLADTAGRKWVPGLSEFFKDNIDFEQLRVRFDYDNVEDDSIAISDVCGYSFLVESNGRGFGMFRFNKADEPCFVSTSGEVYVLDKEYITVKEAKKWSDRRFDIEEIGIYEPLTAPSLQADIIELVDRVNNIDRDKIRLDIEPDYRLVSTKSGRKNFRIGRRALMLLKELTGISQLKSRKNVNKKWDEFSRRQRSQNSKSPREE